MSIFSVVLPVENAGTNQHSECFQCNKSMCETSLNCFLFIPAVDLVSPANHRGTNHHPIFSEDGNFIIYLKVLRLYPMFLDGFPSAMSDVQTSFRLYPMFVDGP